MHASCLLRQTQEVAAKVYATAEHPIVARVLVMLAKIQVHLTYADVCCRMLTYARFGPIVARVLVMLAKIQVHLAASWRRTRI